MKPSAEKIAQRYSYLQIETASHKKRITLLHIRCVELLNMALKSDFIKRRIFLKKAQNILAQLQTSLKMNETTSEGLYYIYDYSFMLLERGNNDDCNKAKEVLSIIRDSFKTIIRMN